MMGIGVMPSEHELYLGMLGTHGKAVANRALHEADLVIVCGARLGDRAVAAPDQMSENTKVIHIDIDPAEIGKNVKTEIPIVGDMKNVINMLLDSIGDYKVTTMWSETVKNWKKDLYREPPVFDGFVEPRTLVGHLSAMFRSKAILVADVGQNQIWCANNFRIREGRFLTTGGMGTMGYSIPAAIGAKFARPDRDVIVICGDGSFQMGLNELATIAGNQLGIKIIIMKNARLGMVRELQDKHYGGRHSATILNGDPDFLKIADAYGIDHAEAHSNKEAENIIKGIVDSEKPFILVCDVHPTSQVLHPKIVTAETKKAMKQILKNIQDGSFAKEFLLDMSPAGRQAHFRAMRKLASEHPSEKVGEQIRALYSFIADTTNRVINIINA